MALSCDYASSDHSGNTSSQIHTNYELNVNKALHNKLVGYDSDLVTIKIKEENIVFHFNTMTFEFAVAEFKKYHAENPENTSEQIQK